MKEGIRNSRDFQNFSKRTLDAKVCGLQAAKLNIQKHYPRKDLCNQGIYFMQNTH